MAEVVLDLKRGFLPSSDPLKNLPKAYQAWEDCAAKLPKLLVAQKLNEELTALPAFPLNNLGTAAELERAMLILSFIGHAYVWGNSAAKKNSVPARLAEPSAKRQFN